jgi:hypothetical protein
VIVRWGVLATPRRGGRALPVWFRFKVFREWIDHTLDELLRRKWDAPTNGVGIPATYGQLDAGSINPRPAVALWRATALTLACDDGALTAVRPPSLRPSPKSLGESHSTFLGKSSQPSGTMETTEYR